VRTQWADVYLNVPKSNGKIPANHAELYIACVAPLVKAMAGNEASLNLERGLLMGDRRDLRRTGFAKRFCTVALNGLPRHGNYRSNKNSHHHTHGA
jgi:hypothetical protein